MSKRTLDSFFARPSKKPRPNNSDVLSTDAKDAEATDHNPTNQENINAGAGSSSPPASSPAVQTSTHPSYPWPLPHLPAQLTSSLSDLVTAQGKAITNQPDLDLLYFRPFIPRPAAQDLFAFLRSNLFFYRVTYNIKRSGTETTINTPRYTTVFGVDDTSRFTLDPSSDGAPDLVDATTNNPIPPAKYRCIPRPIPQCLAHLLAVTSAATNTSYNFCLVNYYARGTDSISMHSDDEAFLGPSPAIASFTLGDAQRDFAMKHKPARGPGSSAAAAVDAAAPLTLRLGAGDMVLMRGPTQANWLHGVPKRKGAAADRGRINITLRKAMVPAGTENYYRYNVGGGGVYRWDQQRREMVSWNGNG